MSDSFRDLLAHVVAPEAKAQPVRAALREQPGDSVAAAISGLDDENAAVREGAAYWLGQSDDPRALQPLLDELAQSETARRVLAARALGEFGDSRAIEPLLALLTRRRPRELDGDDYLMWDAASSALGRLRARQAVDPLLDALSVDDLDVRDAAVWALGEIGDPRAVPKLVQLLETGDMPLGAWVADALERIGACSCRPALEEFYRREPWARPSREGDGRTPNHG